MTIHRSVPIDPQVPLTLSGITPPPTATLEPDAVIGPGASAFPAVPIERRQLPLGPMAAHHGDAIMIDAVLVHVAAVAAGLRPPASWDPSRDARAFVRERARKRYLRRSFLPVS